MEHKIKIKKDCNGYFITLNGLADDEDVIKYLGITDNIYFGKGIEFGGKVPVEYVLYFYYKRDIMKFKRWLEINIDGFLIAKKLVGE
jgi:hypothetical protein